MPGKGKERKNNLFTIKVKIKKDNHKNFISIISYKCGFIKNVGLYKIYKVCVYFNICFICVSLTKNIIYTPLIITLFLLIYYIQNILYIYIYLGKIIYVTLSTKIPLLIT